MLQISFSWRGWQLLSFFHLNTSYAYNILLPGVGETRVNDSTRVGAKIGSTWLESFVQNNSNLTPVTRHSESRLDWFNEIKKLRFCFMTTVIKIGFLNEVLNKFCHPNITQKDDVLKAKKFIFFDIPYVGKPAWRLYKNISRLILKVSDVKVGLIYRTRSRRRPAGLPVSYLPLVTSVLPASTKLFLRT